MRNARTLFGALSCAVFLVACGRPEPMQSLGSTGAPTDQRVSDESNPSELPVARDGGEQVERIPAEVAPDVSEVGSAAEEQPQVYVGADGTSIELPAFTRALLQALESDLVGKSDFGSGPVASFGLDAGEPLLPQDKARIVLQAAVDLLVELRLDQSEDMISVVPVLLRGAVSALDSFTPESRFDPSELAAGLTRSLLLRSGTLAGALQSAAQLRGVAASVALDQLVQAVVRAAVPALVDLQIGYDRLPAALEEVVRNIVGSVVGRLSSGLESASRNEIRILPVSEVSRILEKVIENTFLSLAQLRLPGIGGSLASESDLSRLKEIALSVVYGGTRGLADLGGAVSSGGLKVTDIPVLARSVAVRSLQSVVNFARSQLGASIGGARSQIAELAESIAQGLISGIDRIKVPGFNAALLKQTVDDVITVLVAALNDLNVDDLTEQEIEDFATSVAEGTAEALADLDVRAYFTVTREDLIRVGAAAAARAVADLPIAGKDESLVGRLMGAVTTGAAQGITDWANGSLDGPLLSGLLKSVSGGVTDAVGTIEIGGRRLDDLAGLTLQVVESAGRVVAQMRDPDTQKSLVRNILNGVVAGALQSLEQADGETGAAASLQDHLSRIEGGIGGLLGSLLRR
jgi:hypothetical protein